MNLKQLEYFVDLAQTLSYTKTAHRLYVSQTAITKQIKSLESELGVMLFERDKRHVSLTAAGAVFREEAVGILNQVRTSQLHLEAYCRGERGTFRIGFLKDFDFVTLQTIVSEFHKHYPDVQLELSGRTRRELEEFLLSGELDVILSIDASDTPSFKKTFVKSYPLVAVIPSDHPLAKRQSVATEELSNLVYDARKEQDSKSNSELEGAMLKVSCSLGEAIVNEFVVSPDMLRYVSVIPLRPRQTRDVFIMWHENEYNILITNFAAVLLSIMKNA